MIAIEIGQPWTYPLSGEGLTTLMEPGSQGLDVTLVAALARPSKDEIRALTKEPVRVGLLTSSPLVWILLVGHGVSLDSPYALGLHTPARVDALTEAANKALGWSDTTRGLLTFATVDARSGLVAGLRAVSLSGAWWAFLAGTLSAVADGGYDAVTAADRDAAMARDYRRWPTPAAMLAACKIVETAGAV